MLSTSEVEMLHVDDQILMALPEHVARQYNVLPVARDETGLHLVVPASTLEQEVSIVDEIRYYAVDDQISYQTAALTDLSPKIDYLWARLKSTVHSCGRRFFFRFRCPKVWASLAPTSTPGIRFCDVCHKNVYFASTADELELHARAGHCTAYSQVHTWGELTSLIGDVCEL
ncbi:MAG: hypothetical protein JSS49_27905 [Planctomycetes bacterium]|nr:hypothetical protein [Planctomycetota bacterium]